MKAAGAFAPACRGLTFRDSLPSGARCGLSVRPLRRVRFAKGLEFFHRFFFSGGHKGKGGFLVGIGNACARLRGDFLTDDFQRKREAIGVSIGARTHGKSDFGNGGCSFDGKRDFARAKLRGGGGRVGHAQKIAKDTRESIAERKKIIFFLKDFFEMC